MAAPLFVSPHIKGYFFHAGRPDFIIMLNTSCLVICFAIYARQKFFHNALLPNGTSALFEFWPGINSETNDLTLSIYSYNKNLISKWENPDL